MKFNRMLSYITSAAGGVIAGFLLSKRFDPSQLKESDEGAERKQESNSYQDKHQAEYERLMSCISWAELEKRIAALKQEGNDCEASLFLSEQARRLKERGDLKHAASTYRQAGLYALKCKDANHLLIGGDYFEVAMTIYWEVGEPVNAAMNAVLAAQATVQASLAAQKQVDITDSFRSALPTIIRLRIDEAILRISTLPPGALASDPGPGQTWLDTLDHLVAFSANLTATEATDPQELLRKLNALNRQIRIMLDESGLSKEANRYFVFEQNCAVRLIEKKGWRGWINRFMYRLWGGISLYGTDRHRLLGVTIAVLFFFAILYMPASSSNITPALRLVILDYPEIPSLLGSISNALATSLSQLAPPLAPIDVDPANNLAYVVFFIERLVGVGLFGALLTSFRGVLLR